MRAAFIRSFISTLVRLIRAALIRSIIGALVLLGLASFAIDWNELVRPGGVHYTDDASLDGDPTQLKARVAGYLTDVPVADYHSVRRGDLLYGIDDRDYRARADRARAEVAQAEAAAAVAEAQLAQQNAQIGVAQARISSDDAELERTRQERDRQAAMLHTESYLARDWENAVSAEREQQATATGDRRALAAEQEQLDVLRAQLAGQRATLAARQAALAHAEVELGYTRIVAPFDGTPTARLVRRGDYVAPGTALITLVPLQGVWAVANFREVQLAHMRPGQPARVTVDALPGVVFSGHLDSLEPVSQAEGAPVPPDRAAGSFTKIVQRVPVKIVLDPRPELADRLRPGLSAEVEINTAALAP